MPRCCPGSYVYSCMFRGLRENIYLILMVRSCLVHRLTNNLPSRELVRVGLTAEIVFRVTKGADEY